MDFFGFTPDYCSFLRNFQLIFVSIFSFFIPIFSLLVFFRGDNLFDFINKNYFAKSHDPGEF